MRFANLQNGHVLDLSSGKEYPLVALREELTEHIGNGNSYIYKVTLLGNVLSFSTYTRLLTMPSADDVDFVYVALDYRSSPMREVRGHIIPRIVAASVDNLHGEIVPCNDQTLL
jgi:hypothetical protein